MSSLGDEILASIKAEGSRVTAPSHKRPNKAIYLAGKIRKNDWRLSIVSNLRHTQITGDEPWPILSRAIFNRFDYAGPYFRRCDHGCAHRNGTHGVGLGEDCFDLYVGKHSEDEQHHGRSVIFRQCMAAIACADLVFVWLDTLDAYGTIFELGVAHAMGKPLYAIGPKRFDDLWFIYEATGGMHEARDEGQTPEWALRRILQGIGWFCESPIEEAFWKAWHDAGNQRKWRLEPQQEVLGGKYRLDFAHVASKTAIELDGYDYHASKEQFINDRERQRALEAEGWYVMRFAGSEIHRDAEKCCGQVAEAIGRRMPPA